MADNYIERQYEAYLERKAAAEKARRLKWQKQLKRYAETLKTRPDTLNDNSKSG